MLFSSSGWDSSTKGTCPESCSWSLLVIAPLLQVTTAWKLQPASPQAKQITHCKNRQVWNKHGTRGIKNCVEADVREEPQHVCGRGVPLSVGAVGSRSIIQGHILHRVFEVSHAVRLVHQR